MLQHLFIKFGGRGGGGGGGGGGGERGYLVHLFIFGLNKEVTQRKRVFSFFNLKDKSPLIGLMHYLYD